MTSRDELVNELANQWVAKAQADYDAARVLSEHGGEHWAIVAFHCQQAAEKFIKGLLTALQIEFGKTHDIAVLVDKLVGVKSEVVSGLRPAEALTVYGVQVRYPGDGPDVDRDEAEAALALAGVVAEIVLAELDGS